MRLKRLELQGFKSFLDRTILTFDQSITGVVGPNGCGKSNIVDAIQWVMGEQSAKHLRGDQMTDVIFNGSDTKAAMSMAEVSLVLDREGVILSPAFAAFDKADEISITRRVYRDGTGEYFINKTVCRLKDIHELFMDTGVGKRAYSIIEQGQIDRMINVKPEERRHLFEEVAGITKYKAKRKEAERKLEATRGNMVRLDDIIAELEKQIRSLKIQATRARKYREIKSELEAVDLYLLGRNLYNHKKNIAEIEEKRDARINERSQSDAEFGRIESQVTELEVARIDQERAYQALSEQEKTTLLLIQRLENELNLMEQRKAHLSEGLEKDRTEEAELGREIEMLSSSIATEEAEKERLGQELIQLEESGKQLEEEMHTQEMRGQELQRKKSGLQDRKLRLSQRAASLEQQRTFAIQRETEVQEARTALNQRLSDIVVVIDSQKEALKKADEKIAECAARAEAAEKDVTSIHGEVQALSQRLSEMEDGLYKSRENFHSQKSRLESLTELQTNLEGYSSTAREILKQLEGSEVTAVPLAEVLQPEADIEDHVETLLGLDMNTLIVRSSEEAERLSKLVTEKDLERVRILALSDLNRSAALSQSPTAMEAGQTAQAVGAIPLLSMVRVNPGYENAVQWWLGQTYLCDNVDQLFRLRSDYPELTFLSRSEKTIAHPNRSVTSGKLPSKMGVFARRREIEDLGTHCQALEAELTQLTQTREAVLSNLESHEKLHSEQKDRLSKIHIESVEHRKEREKIQIEMNRTDRDYTSLMNESERNLRQIDECLQMISRLAEDKVAMEQEEGEVETGLVAVETEIAERAEGFAALNISIQEKRVERSRVAERLSGIDGKIEKLHTDFEISTSHREELKDSIEKADSELSGLDQKAGEVQVQKGESEKDRDRIVVELSDKKNEFNDTCNTLQNLKDQKADLQKRRDIVVNEIQELEIQLAHETSTLEHLVGISQERYQKEPTLLDENATIDLALLPLFVEQLNLEWAPLPEAEKKTLLEEHLKNLKEKVTRYGEVNLTAIQEFEEIQKRYDFLMEQKADLEKSIGILEDAIKRIEETTKIRFEETFEAVNKKFKEIFPILFNGGKAELTLIQPENGIGDSGVDIMASPPGKRLQSITLLSGGEKALTAVSLVLAIFARKPSPFCLLDEVDAPLDDANVSRFNTVIRKMAEKTQFIVITHNKKTMEIAEALYGVTMEKPGISKMSSVRLS